MTKDVAVRGVLVKANDERMEVSIPTNYPFQLKTMYELLKTDMIEAVTFDMVDMVMWIDEEGKLKNKPVNRLPTNFYHLHFGHRDPIAGHAVFTGPADERGDITSLDDFQVQSLLLSPEKLAEQNPETFAMLNDLLSRVTVEAYRGRGD